MIFKLPLATAARATGQRWVAAQIDASIEQIQEKMEMVRSVSAAAYGSAGVRQAWKSDLRI